MAALSISVLSEVNRGRNVVGRDREVYADVTGPTSYTSGGETLTLAQLQALCPGLGKVVGDWSKVKFVSSETNAGGYRVVLDRTNHKLLFFDENSEAAGDLTTQTVRVKVVFNA